MNVFYRILLGLACIALAYFCVDSVVTPIRFENKKAEREAAVVKNLMALRTAEAEYILVNNRYQPDFDSLMMFLKSSPKKDVLKEGSLSDKQLETGMTEQKAAKILERALIQAKAQLKTDDKDALYKYVWENNNEVKTNGLVGFRRDTVYKNMIEVLYKGEYTIDNIDQITYIPYTDSLRFEIKVDNNYKTTQGIRVPIMEISADYNTYLSDLDAQELVNLIDKETKLEHYTGLKIGSIEAPNNNAGNWE